MIQINHYFEEGMTTQKEFSAKVKEIQAKLDFVDGTHQKNKALLQYLKEFCATTLAGSNPDEAFEKEIKTCLFQTEKDLKKITDVQPMENKISMHGSSPSKQYNSGGYMPPQPTHQALDSVTISSFDPSSSPILRRLSNKQPLSPRTQLKATTKKKSVKKKTQDPSKIKKGQLKSIEATPFPAPKPFPSPTVTEVAEEPKWDPAYLRIEQLQITMDLPFKENIQYFGRQEFLNRDFPVIVPEKFFDPILEHNPLTEPSEHCVIEQPERGVFVLKDRFAQQKTYCNGAFVDAEGIVLNEGDSFILPVSINDQLSSLAISFHKGKSN
ncbi:hypothetical protein WKT22_03467 [Candidatus Lokiarchaeum ossiferum]